MCEIGTSAGTVPLTSLRPVSPPASLRRGFALPLGDVGLDSTGRGSIRRLAVIIVGLVLLVVGFVLKVAILWTIGIIVLLVGLILLLLGSIGHAVGGRRHYF